MELTPIKSWQERKMHAGSSELKFPPFIINFRNPCSQKFGVLAGKRTQMEKMSVDLQQPTDWQQAHAFTVRKPKWRN